MELIKNLSKAIMFLLVIIVTVLFFIWLHKMLMWFVIACVFTAVIGIIFRKQVWSGIKKIWSNRQN